MTVEDDFKHVMSVALSNASKRSNDQKLEKIKSNSHDLMMF